MASNQKSTKKNPLSTADGYFRCGYSVYNLDKYETRYFCLWCSLIIKEPYQLTECGHRVCRGCFESRVAMMGEDEERICPESYCGIPFRKDQFMCDRAFRRELESLPVVCVHKEDKQCPWIGTLTNYQEHLDQNHAHHLCDLCGTEFTSASAVEEHRSTQCPKLFQKCPLAPYCTEDVIRNEDFDEHLLSEKHQETIALILAGKVSVEESAAGDDDMETSSADQQLETQLGEKFNELGEKIQKLSDDTIELNREFIKLNELSQVVNSDFNQMQNLINRRNKWLNDLQIEQLDIQKQMEEVKGRLDENECVSTDGTCTWRIDRVAERMADAQSERQPSIFSPIFYSAINGYKMRARLYLHGDGSARRTHISLFFLLVKGEYDAILPWPFQHKVTFCLFDQSPAGRHIIDSFRPDVKSSSFHRPTGSTNIASGIPKFFPLPMLQQDDSVYVRDDTMFIKIMVDLFETPKTVLPYYFTLNPGFPYHVQQHLINQEKIKQQQPQQQQSATVLKT